MNATLERAVTVGRAIVHELRVEKVTFVAGSIAYHAFVSLLPFLLLVIAVLSAVGNPPEEAIVSLAGAVLTEDAGDALLRELDAAGASTGVSALGGVVLLWGALRIFRGLDTAFSAIYETEAHNTIADQFADAVVVFLTVGLAIAVAWGVDAVLATDGPGLGAWLLERLVLVCGLGLVLLPMYYVFPDADVSIREVVPGVVVAAVGLVLFVSVFQFYAALRTGEDSSVIVGILVLLTWLYVSGLIVLVGAAVNAVLSNRSQDVDIDPVIGFHTTDSTRAADRDRLAADLRRVATSVEEGDELRIVAGETDVRLASPRRATAETNDSALDLDDETLTLEFEWPPGETTER
ncbi:YhjD/YihY/BrkB family envelope integrity protein [Halococcus agarilyticus]|uniref:YhjD/YihY/BrkB family envelope integrity protein n=1 Tax=Halococcus agarilyticus TaxID=1232219 RepID=UPI000677E041|nr:YhjD/YihY/BrkB family envelope integrity protein [Halococcus agarilyticus]